MAEQMPTPAHQLLAQLIAGTGLRIGEARSLTVDRLDLTAEPPAVRVDRQLLGQATSPGAQLAFGPPKGGRAGRRSVAIPDALAEQLREHVAGLAPAAFVFESTQYANRSMNPRSLGEVWQHAAARAGIDSSQHRGWHSLRHHHASRLIAAGVSVVAVQRRLGHSSASITLSTYSHLWPTDEQRILNALDTS